MRPAHCEKRILIFVPDQVFQQRGRGRGPQHYPQDCDPPSKIQHSQEFYTVRILIPNIFGTRTPNFERG